MKKERLPGINPQNVEGFVLRPVDDTQFYVVPSRGMDILEARINHQPVLWSHPSGHLKQPCGDLDHIEGFFTAGIENTGPPAMGLPVHGSFAWRWADSLEWIDTKESVGVRGTIHATDMVRGPYVDVTRTVSAHRGRRGFRVEDVFTANVDSDFMLLYHPNFPVREGDTFTANALAVKSRDPISDLGLGSFSSFMAVGQGQAVLPPSREAPEVVNENFEQAYVILLKPDPDGFITAMLVAGDNQSATVIRYGGDGFDSCQQSFVLWKNPRGSVCGMERGNTFCGREWAKDNNLVSRISCGQTRTYIIEVDFLIDEQAIDAAIARYDIGGCSPELISSDTSLADFYRREISPIDSRHDSR